VVIWQQFNSNKTGNNLNSLGFLKLTNMDFEKIYFECNVKPLFERVLREADNNEVAVNGSSPLSQTRKTARDALGLNITKNQIILFTEENYKRELGGDIKTPVEVAKMSETNWAGGTEGAFQKMNDKSGRQEDIFKVKTTLTDPSIIIKTANYNNRNLYAKVFDDSSFGGKERQVFSVIVDNGSVISNYNRDHLRIREFVNKFILSPENLIWSKR
jgi:hypothetical protein